MLIYQEFIFTGVNTHINTVHAGKQKLSLVVNNWIWSKDRGLILHQWRWVWLQSAVVGKGFHGMGQ